MESALRFRPMAEELRVVAAEAKDERTKRSLLRSIHYRIMAQQMRAIAAAATHKQRRASFLNAAANYERFATTLELVERYRATHVSSKSAFLAPNQ
jgi:hypothetical protein